MSFFESEIVQSEAKQIFEDYQNLIQLGARYGKFDREGKRLYIEQMEMLLERYRIFMKRVELSEDFMAQMMVKQLETFLGQFGLTPQQMFAHMEQTLERMKRELEP
jgi:phosphoenolpyruvate carboxylase